MKKRQLKSQKQESEEEVKDEEIVYPHLPMSTYDQILKNATESEATRLNRTLKLRATIRGKYIFAGEETITKTKRSDVKKRQDMNQEIKSQF